MNKKIAIFFLGDFRFDGRCCNMINSLTKNNQVYIYHNQDKNFDATNNNKNLRIINIPVTQKKWVKYLEWFWKVSRFNIHAYDTVIASEIYSLYPLSFKKNSQKVVFDCREIYTELAVHKKNKIKNIFLSFMEYYCLKKIYKVITTATTDNKYLQKKYSRYHHITYSNIYNFPYKHKVKKSNFLRKKFGINTNYKILLYQGVIQRNRGIKQFINIINKSNKICGVIIGYGESEKYFHNIVKEKNLQKRIYFLGKIPYNNILQISSSADIGYALIPPVGLSNQLALPNKIFEYSAARIPTLSSKLINMEKIIKKYHIGECFDYNDTDSHINFILNTQKETFFINKSNNFNWDSQEKKFNDIIIND